MSERQPDTEWGEGILGETDSDIGERLGTMVHDQTYRGLRTVAGEK